MVIRTQYGFNEIPPIADNTLVKLHVHNHTRVIYIQYKFYDIQPIGLKVIAEDGKNFEI